MYTKKDVGIFSEMLQKDDVLIFTHENPDGDALGTAFALKRIFENNKKRAWVCCSDEPSSRFAFISDQPTLLSCPFKEKCVVAVDVAVAERLGDGFADYRDRVDYAIDHHFTNDGYAKNSVIKADASSTGEILWNLIKRAGIRLDSYIAAKLYTAISFDTGCFKFANVRPVTMNAAADLLKYKIPFEDINRRLFDLSSVEQLKIETAVISTLERYCGGRVTVLFLRQQTVKECGAEGLDVEGLSAIPRRIEGTVVGLMIKETPEGNVKVSLRSFDDRIDVSKVASVFGGGGHKRAAGCMIKDEDFETSKKNLIKAACDEWNSVFPNGYSE